MNFKLKVWRQKDGASAGAFKDYDAKEIPSEASFLEMLDIVNETLAENGEDPIAFDSDCREGICGTCSLVINGIPHGPGKGTTCQLYMRRFADGETIWIEPFRATAFRPIKDLVVDRSAFDRIIEAGGYIVVRTGSAPEANALPVPKHVADLCDGGGRLHRMRRLCGRLPKLFCDVVRFRQGLAPRSSAAGSGGTRKPRTPYGPANG